MKDLLTKENIKKLVIFLLVAAASYFGYDLVVTPKGDATNIEAPVSDSLSVDSTLLDSIK